MIRILRVLGALALAAASHLHAGTPVPVWATAIPDGVPGLGETLSARYLGDGTLLVVLRAGGGGGDEVRAVHLDAEGAVLGSVRMPAPSWACADIDGNGSVFVSGNLWGSANVMDVTKWDGLTGAPLWRTPPALSRNASVESLTVDERGDVVFRMWDIGFEANTLSVGRIDGATGAVLARWAFGEDQDLFGMSVTGSTVTGLTQDYYGGALGLFRIGAPAPPAFFVPGRWWVSAAAPDPAGGFAFANAYGPGCYAAAVDGSGGLRWSRLLLEIGSSCHVDGVLVDDQGALLLAGSADSRAFVARLALSDGSLLGGPWRLTPAAGASSTTRLLFRSGGAFFAAGETTGNDGAVDSWLAALEGPLLATRWGPVGVPRETGQIAKLLLSPRGELVSVGSGTSSAGPVLPTILRWNVADGSAIGDPIPLKISHGVGRVRQLRVDAEGNLSALLTEPSRHVSVARLDAAGQVSWHVDLGRSDASPSLAASASGDVFVATADQGIRKFSSVDGSTSWGPVALPTAWPYRWGLGTDGAGDVYIVGEGPTLTRLSGADGTRLYGAIAPPATASLHVEGPTVTGWAAGTLVRWDAASGSVLWSYSGSAASYVEALAVGPSQEVVLASYANPATRVSRLEPGASSPAWSVSIDSLFPRFAAIDTAGDVYVVGSRNGAALCRKLSGLTGATVWERTGNVGFLGGDFDSTLDDSGVLLVAGTRFGAATLTDAVVEGYRTDTGIDAFPMISWRGLEGSSATCLVSNAGLPIIGAQRGDDDGAVVVAFRSGLGFPGAIPAPAFCGIAYVQDLGAANGVLPVAHGVVSGALPPGLSLDASSGVLSGVPSSAGVFHFRLRAADATTASVERDVTVRVAGGEIVRIVAEASDPCGATTLSVQGSFGSYSWLPGGETTPSIVVDPSASATYVVAVMDGACTRYGSYTVAVPRPGSLALTAPLQMRAGDSGVASVPARPGRTYTWTVTGGSLVTGQGTARIEFAAGTAGQVGLSAIEESDSGCTIGGWAFTRVTGVATGFFPVRPCRVADTRRYSDGPALAPGEVRRLAIATPPFYDCGIPLDAQSVALNVTVVVPGTDGYVTIYPAGQEKPATSTVNAAAGRTRAAFSVLPLGLGAAVDVFSGFAGVADLVLDVSGYFR